MKNSIFCPVYRSTLKYSDAKRIIEEKIEINNSFEIFRFTLVESNRLWIKWLFMIVFVPVLQIKLSIAANEIEDSPTFVEIRFSDLLIGVLFFQVIVGLVALLFALTYLEDGFSKVFLSLIAPAVYLTALMNFHYFKYMLLKKLNGFLNTLT